MAGMTGICIYRASLPDSNFGYDLFAFLCDTLVDVFKKLTKCDSETLRER